MHERPSMWLRPLAFGIRWSPLAWLFGLSELFAIAAVVVASLALVRTPWTRLQWPVVSMAAFLLTGIVGLAWAVARGAPPDRAAAAAFNLGVWTLGFLVWLIVRNHERQANRVMLLRSVRDAGLWAGVAAVIMLLAWLQGMRGLSFAAPISVIVPDGVLHRLPAILASTVEPVVFRLDWFFGHAVPRLQAFHPYPNALALTSGLAIVAHIALRDSSSIGMRRRRIPFVAAMVLLALPLVLTWSRAILLVFAAAGVLAFAVRAVPAGGRSIAAFVLVWLAIVIATGVILNPSQASDVLANVGETRAGSTATRINLYVLTWDLALERPWIGNGIKPHLDGTSIPIGSHSTFLGIALKNGVLGLMLVIVWAVSLGARSLMVLIAGSHAQRAIAIGVLMILAWSLIEDLDAPIVASVQAFTFIGMLFHHHDGS